MDLINRQDAIDICINAIDLWNGQIGCGALIAIKDKIADLPSAQQWIPVSERLPEVDVFVLVTLQHFNGETDVIIAKVVKGYFSNELEWESDNGEWTWGVECGFAWMPLPGPYKAPAPERDCEHCVHHTDKGCSSWDCEYERRQ